MRQKILCMIMLFALMLAFTGCGSGKAVSAEDPAAASDVETEGNTGTVNADAEAADETDIAAAGQNGSGDVQQENDQGNTDTLVSEDFLMQIEDVFSLTDRGTVVTGLILSGQVSIGAEVELVGFADSTKNVVIGGIESFTNRLDTAKAGDNVGISLNVIEEADVQRGQVLAAKGFIAAHDTFTAEIIFAGDQDDAFFSQGGFIGQSYFFTTDSNTAYYFGQVLPDENGRLSVTAQTLARLPMKEGTTFRVKQDGKTIASGVVTGVDADITAVPGFENINLPDITAQFGADGIDDGPAIYSVQLLSYGTQKVNVIKVIREITGLDLKAAKELADYTPSIVKDKLTQKEAESIRSKLEEAGASAEIIE
jgi:ribosomal protein L7/L12